MAAWRRAVKRTPEDWRERARKLAALAEDQRGKPEGEVARRKLTALINRHPEAASFAEVQTLARRDITLADVGYMRRAGISTDGEWTAGTLAEAIERMTADYAARIDAHCAPRLEGKAQIEA